MSKQLLCFADAFAQQHDYRQIRLDTYSTNPIALAAYESYGYEVCGFVDFGREHLFTCLEKSIEPVD